MPANAVATAGGSGRARGGNASEFRTSENASRHGKEMRLGSFENFLNEWRASYPAEQRHLFQKDGVVVPQLYKRESIRLLFVLLEANNKKDRHDSDIREVFGKERSRKSISLNMARWTLALLDGKTKYRDFIEDEAIEQHRRVAIMNLKKLAGSGTKHTEKISVQAWRDRRRIIREVELIRPTVIVTCGETANRLFYMIVVDDPFADSIPEKSIWHYKGMKVLPGNHPSVRPKDAEEAFQSLIRRAKACGVGAFSANGGSWKRSR